ncbi:MAG: glycosyltransferase family protein [Cyclobacteriaceae bacterium]
MRFLFLVQGEGRGHMTQAMTLCDMLEENGYKVCAVMVGAANQRQIPSFFTQHFTCPVHEVDSPKFITDRYGKSVDIPATIIKNVLGSRRYLKSLGSLHRLVTECRPDVIINFYDFLGGIYAAYYKPSARYVVIGHQYLSHHPEFPFAPGKRSDKRLLLLNNHISALKADLKLALSFRPYPDHTVDRLKVVPPLVREAVKCQQVTDEGYLLVYMVNHGYADQVVKWHKKNPDVRLHCFWHHKDYADAYSPHKNLTFHPLDGEKFMKMMACCRAYVSTAGFESVCEAMYLGKPALLVPVEGHYEQACNAVDATVSGAGVQASRFDLDKLMQFLPHYDQAGDTFKKWVDSAEAHLLKLLTGSASGQKDYRDTAEAKEELYYA